MNFAKIKNYFLYWSIKTFEYTSINKDGVVVKIFFIINFP